MSDTSISRKEYRNNRFTSDLGDLWQRESRSSFLARIAIESLPDRIIHMLEQKGLSLIDYGCAAGAGTAYIISHFPSLHVTGVDFSEEAVHKAISQHPQYNFEVGDLTGKLKEADIVFSSNMFEYLNDPLACLEQMVESAKQAAIVILPFEDSLTTKGHHHPFDVDSFPMEIGKHCLTYFRVIDCQDMPNTRWAGKQVLLVYALSTVHSPLSVGELYREWIGKLFDASHKFKRDLEYQQKQHEDALELQKSQFKQEQQEQDKELSDIVAAYSGLKSKQTRAAMDQINSISQTRLYRLMHFMVEAWHAFFGKKEERIRGKEYLFKNRKTITDYNYSEQIRTNYITIGDTSVLRREFSKLLMARSITIIKKAIDDYPGKDVYVMPAFIDWNIPLFQRPQQIALGLVHNGVLFFFITFNSIDQIVDAFAVEDRLIVARKEALKSIIDLANKANKRVVISLYATVHDYDEEWLKQWKNNNYTILYEYVDEISEQISGKEMPHSAMNRHKAFIKDPKVNIVATAGKLYDEVVAVRGEKNVLLSGNGVDIKHFQQPIDWKIIPDSLKRIFRCGQPVIGYYGAVAVWFDYDLVYKAATDRPDYYFLIIGPQYGDPTKTNEKIELLKTRQNVIFTGTIDYKVLPHFANNFTVATIPFILNDVTESTSPIKLFEYMAMGKPIVTTAMRECIKHPEVMIARDADEYVQLLDKAVAIVKSPEYPTYIDSLHRVAHKNSWDEKAREIIDLVSNG